LTRIAHQKQYHRRLSAGRIEAQIKIAKMNPRPALLNKERKPYTWPLRRSGVMNQNLGPFNLAILSGQIQPLDWAMMMKVTKI
jgi:hypothetical protein